MIPKNGGYPQNYPIFHKTVDKNCGKPVWKSVISTEFVENSKTFQIKGRIASI